MSGYLSGCLTKGKIFSYRAENFERQKKCIGHNMPKYYSVSHCPNIISKSFFSK